MTIEQEIRRRLQENGMAPDSIEPCMAFIKAELPSMGSVWKDDKDGHSTGLIETCWMASSSLAVDWMAAQMAPVKGELK